jgi:Flp pilus assembly pilin Flp
MLIRSVLRFVREENGQDLIEYALLTAIVGLASILIFPSIATKMGAAYASWVDGAESKFMPCDPGASC